MAEYLWGDQQINHQPYPTKGAADREVQPLGSYGGFQVHARIWLTSYSSQ